MADQLSQTSPPAAAAANVEISRDWRVDCYSGTRQALIDAGIITADQLKQQAGRAPGHAIFLPDGSPCPLRAGAWREPGYKMIRLYEDETCRVEITVSKEEQSTRRAAERIAEAEAAELRINQELAKNGQQLRRQSLKHGFGHQGDWPEWWEGTKAQLQAAGIGVGLAFPGEAGSPSELHCSCPLGFDVCIRQMTWDPVKTAVGIYLAQSWYVPMDNKYPRNEYAVYAPGVLKDMAHVNGGWCSDMYIGTAQDLVNASLVQSIDLFPGQPGRNKGQCSYKKNWNAQTCASGGHDEKWAATIRRRGNSKFEVELPLSQEEFQRRKAAHAAQEEEREAAADLARVERIQLRLLRPPAKVSAGKAHLRLVWSSP